MPMAFPCESPWARGTGFAATAVEILRGLNCRELKRSRTSHHSQRRQAGVAELKRSAKKMAQTYKKLILDYCTLRSITVPVGFGRNSPGRFAVIRTDQAPPKLVATTW